MTPGGGDETVFRELATLGCMDVREYVEGKQDWIQARFPIEGQHPDEHEVLRSVVFGVHGVRDVQAQVAEF